MWKPLVNFNYNLIDMEKTNKSQLTVSEVKKLAKSVSAKEFMRRNFNSPYLALEDVDNICNYNEGYCNVTYTTPTDTILISFFNGEFNSAYVFNF
jgi:hypothetical protein